MMRSFGLLMSLSLAGSAAFAAEGSNDEQEKMIRDSAAKYAEAYSRGDVDALAAMYAPEADYDDASGQVVRGRDAIRKKLQEELAQSPGTKMTIEVNSIKFVHGRAYETGVATLKPREGEPTAVPYRAIHVKGRDGKWLITRVGPDADAEGVTSAGPLEPLAWMIGTWRGTEENVNLRSVCSWTDNHRFILRAFTISDEKGDELKVSEVIGWDPGQGVVRSWVFDSAGGFAQSTWSKRGDDWIILARATLPDGASASAVHTIHPVDANTFTWSSTNREVDAEMLPDVQEVRMVRAPETQPAGEVRNGGQP